jgi:hypothetical protein
MTMTKTELRVEALRLAAARLSNPNTIQLAGEFLTFLTADHVDEPPAETKPAQQPQQGKQRK